MVFDCFVCPQKHVFLTAMAWDTTSTLLLFTIIPQILLLIFSLIYNFLVIIPNQDKSLWKIRRPKYFLFYLIITLSNDTLRCLSSLLLHLNIFHLYWYQLLSIPLAYFGGMTWGSIRLYLLYCDIKLAKQTQLTLLSSHLSTKKQSRNKTGVTKQYSLKQYQYLTLTVTATMTLFCIITIITDIGFGHSSLSRMIQYGFVFSVFIAYTYFLFLKMWNSALCKRKNKQRSLQTSPFRDDWLLLTELTVIWIIWMIGLISAITTFNLRETEMYPVIIAYITMITRCMITMVVLYTPYRVIQRVKKSNQYKISLSTLQNILSTESYFYGFVDHLVQEISIEVKYKCILCKSIRGVYVQKCYT